MRASAYVVLLACSGTPSATLNVTVGGEPDAFTRVPAPTDLIIEAIHPDGSTNTLLATVPLSANAKTIDLGLLKQEDAIAVRVTGTAGPTQIVAGQSVSFQPGALQTNVVNVFVQRIAESARMPGTLADPRPFPLLGISERRTIVFLGSSEGAKSAIFYDLAPVAPVEAVTTLPRVPLSMALYKSAALLIDAAGADAVDFSSGVVDANIAAPAGGSWPDVAGGITVLGDGSSYIVGATRISGTPTKQILVLSDTGAVLPFGLLAFARTTAAAAWIPGRGLVIAGGNATDSGVELLSKGASVSTSLPFPPDPSSGTAAAFLDGSVVLLAGGRDDKGQPLLARTIDIACSTSCAPQPWGQPFPALDRAQLVRITATSVLLVGDDAVGTRLFLLSPTESKEIALKLAHKGARAIALPTGGIAIAGGSSTVESVRF